MTQEDIEKVFRKKANAEVYDGMYAREFGFIAQMGKINHRDREIDDDNKKNKSASQFAESCEHFFKAPIIYHDLRNSNIILNSNPNDFDDVIEEHLKSPKKIQGLLLGSDPRKNKSLIASQNVQNDKVSGHDLYAYYQLQNPVINALINHEYLTRDGEDVFNWINFGILTQDYLEYDSNNSLKIPVELLEFLDKEKSAFETLRYTSTHGGSKAATSKDIDFLIHLSGGLENIMDILYPQYDEHFNFDFSKLKNELGFSINEYRMPGSIKKTFKKLDKISSFYLNNDFSKKEFEFFVEQLSKINSDSSINDNEKMIYRSIYTNLCIYLKHCTSMIEANIYFNQKVFERIEKYCRLVITSNLFDKNSVKLKDNTFFITHKSELQAELELNRKQTSLNNRKNKIYKKFNITSDICLTEEDLEILENIKKYEIYKLQPELFIFSVLSINKPSVLIKLPSMKEYKSNPEFFTSKALAYNTIEQIINVLNSDEYRGHPEAFTTEVLSHKTFEQVQEILASKEYKEHSEMFNSYILSHITLEEFQELISSKEYKEHPELFTSITMSHSKISEIKELISSKEYKEHPELFTSITMSHSKISEIKELINSKEYKEHPELFTSITMSRSKISEIKELINSEEFNNYQEMFSPSYLRILSIREIKTLIDLCKDLKIDDPKQLLKYSPDSIERTYTLCKELGIEFKPFLVGIKPSILLKKKKLFEKLGIEYTSTDFLMPTDHIIERFELCDKLGIELTDAVMTMSTKIFNNYKENLKINNNLLNIDNILNNNLLKLDNKNNYKTIKNVNINNKINYKDINYKINERPYIMENPYIGKDGKDYYSREDLEEANRVYYETYEQEKGRRR